MVEEHRTLTRTTEHNFLLCVIRRTAARWQHIARYSQCILFTARIYVCRYISEQKATFGRPAGASGEGRGGEARWPTHPHSLDSPTQQRGAPSVCIERASAPSNRLDVFLLL